LIPEAVSDLVQLPRHGQGDAPMAVKPVARQLG
jgi:hypothetical protein